MNFDEVTPILKKLGRDRKWLAEVTHYTARSINIILSPKGEKSRTAQAMARIEEALRMEEVRQSLPIEIKPVQTLVLQPSLLEFQQWSRQALLEGKIVTDWATDSLNLFADGIILKAGDKETNYKVKRK